jgi:N-acetyl sugar amidotransferase
MSFKGRICSVGVWDESIPDITFDDNGKSSYCILQEKLISEYPRGEEGLKIWKKLVNEMKNHGKNNKYDCIVGVSGGTDSSFLLHICKNFGLRVLAVNLDNGWSSDIAVKNIKKMTDQLKIDLVTYVIEYEEVKAVLRAYLKASLPWVDSPTDMAIKACLYVTARKEKIKYILNGSDFRTEGKQPFQWTYSDFRQLKFLLKKFESKKIKSFPALSYSKLIWLSIIKGIKVIRPYYFLEYSKTNAIKELVKRYNWEYYGGHHHENIYTKFIISYWLYEKFGIDKRKITFSAQIMNGDVSRPETINIINNKPYDSETIEAQLEYVRKKLDFSKEEFKLIFEAPNKYYYNYPSSFRLIFRNLKITSFLSSKSLLYKPSSITQAKLNVN